MSKSDPKLRRAQQRDARKLSREKGITYQQALAQVRGMKPLAHEPVQAPFTNAALAVGSASLGSSGPAGFFEQIKTRVDLVDYVRHVLKVDLRSKGEGDPYWIGLCPFHAEYTPSFRVNRRGDSPWSTWHCFGPCQCGGTVIDAAMMAEGLDDAFEAAVYLNILYGLDLPVQTRSRELTRLANLRRRELLDAGLLPETGDSAQRQISLPLTEEMPRQEFGIVKSFGPDQTVSAMLCYLAARYSSDGLRVSLIAPGLFRAWVTQSLDTCYDDASGEVDLIDRLEAGMPLEERDLRQIADKCDVLLVDGEEWVEGPASSMLSELALECRTAIVLGLHDHRKYIDKRSSERSDALALQGDCDWTLLLRSFPGIEEQVAQQVDLADYAMGPLSGQTDLRPGPLSISVRLPQDSPEPTTITIAKRPSGEVWDYGTRVDEGVYDVLDMVQEAGIVSDRASAARHLTAVYNLRLVGASELAADPTSQLIETELICSQRGVQDKSHGLVSRLGYRPLAAG